MPIFLAFLAGGLFASIATNYTKNNMKVAKEDFDEVLDDRRELMSKIHEILKEKEMNGEIKLNNNN
jgi:hypothetical protein